MAICKYCGKPIEGEYVMNPDENGDGYHHSCLIDKEFREERRRIYNQGVNEVLDKIRAEFISRYPKNYMGEPELGGASCVFSLCKVLEIIDKYKKESEVSE